MVVKKYFSSSKAFYFLLIQWEQECMNIFIHRNFGTFSISNVSNTLQEFADIATLNIFWFLISFTADTFPEPLGEVYCYQHKWILGKLITLKDALFSQTFVTCLNWGEFSEVSLELYPRLPQRFKMENLQQ